MSSNADWFLQWSRIHKRWHCFECGAVADNDDYDSLTHGVKGEPGIKDKRGNLITHEAGCRYWQYISDLSERNGDEEMGIVASSKRDFELPPEGMFQAVCVDVVDLGMVESKFYNKTQHKCRIVWQIVERMEDGRRFIVSRRFTVTLGEQSALRPFLETWRGRSFTPDELKAFDLDSLIGANAMLQILYKTEGEETWANVTSCTPWLKQYGEKIEPEGYVRVQDREPQPDAPASQQFQQQVQQQYTSPRQGAQQIAQARGQAGQLTPISQAANRMPQYVPEADDIPF